MFSRNPQQKQTKETESVALMTNPMTIGTTSLVNTRVEGTSLSLAGLPDDERIFIQGYVSKSDIFNTLTAGVSMMNYGYKDYTESPIYKEFESDVDTLINRLNIILRTMSGSNESDFRRVTLVDGKYVTVEPKEIEAKELTEGEINSIKLKTREQKFPEYNDLLSSYVGGRQESQGGKPSYKNMEYMINYFEMIPLEREHFEAYVKKPIENLRANFSKLSQEQLINLYQGESKFNFKYRLSESALSIFNRLKQIYLAALKKRESTKIHLSSELVPSKEPKIYISDNAMKSGDLLSLAMSLKSQSILDYLELMDAGNYKQWYIKIDKLREILNTILGPKNWTVETTYSKEWNENNVIRGYYVDMLGNFRYGQLVIPKTNNFGNTQVDKDVTMKSKLERTLITEIFPTLRGLSETEYNKIKEIKKGTKDAAVKEAMVEWRQLQDIPKSIGTAAIKPIKRMVEDDYLPRKRFIEDTREGSKTDDEPKEITKEAKGVSIEEPK